jgi:preprotein translocase subunit SecA
MPAAWAGFERNVMLQSLDNHWREHLSALDHLRQGIHLRGYAQKNPKQEYKREAFDLFEGLLQAVRADVIKLLMTAEVRNEAQLEAIEEPPRFDHVNTIIPSLTKRWRPLLINPDLCMPCPKWAAMMLALAAAARNTSIATAS